MKDIVSNKSNENKSKETPPQCTHSLVNDKYIPIEDPYFKDRPNEIKDELLAYWQPCLGYCLFRLVRGGGIRSYVLHLREGL